MNVVRHTSKWCRGAGALALAASVACAYSRTTVTTGRPLDEKAIGGIVIGQTTRSDIFKALGAPHSIFQGQAEFTEAKLLPLYFHSQNRYLSTIDDRHYALLYRFGTGRTATTLILVVSDTKVDIRSDEVLLMMNRQTDVVEDVAYRRETSAQ
jgi:hypothetical protein